ncbi:MAG: transketolase C-terminal domain-containing protein [Eubacteriales bacterium]|nr:transketolase C-terminal domain-containing protein [Eubacteriales bacterium]
MHDISLETLSNWSKLGHRTAIGETLFLLGKENSKVYVATADLTPTARLTHFLDAFPDRFFDVGIAEQNLIDFTAGMAKEGLLTFAVGLAAFIPMRCAEQMRINMGYMNLNVKAIGIEAGVRFGPLGNTHFAMDDIAVARTIPNMTVLAPSDPLSIYKAVYAAANHSGPVYIRLTGAPGFPILYPDDFEFVIGRAIEYKKGRDIAIISTGSVLAAAIGAADLLEAQGISVRVIDMHTIKPLDTAILDRVFAENRLILTVEEHSNIGGLGSAVAEYKAGIDQTPRQIICGLGDSFKKVGSYDFQMQASGLTAVELANVAMANLR